MRGMEGANAEIEKNLHSISKPCGTGIKLKVVDRKTGREVNCGVQLNNTTLEIEALPDVIVSIRRLLLPTSDPVVELLEQFADCKEKAAFRSSGEEDVYKVAAELRHIIGGELAEERRKERCSELGY